MQKKTNPISKFELRSIIREHVQKLLEEQTQYQVGDPVMDNEGEKGVISLAKHPYYAVKLNITGVTKSYDYDEITPTDPDDKRELQESEPDHIIHIEGILTSDTTIKVQSDILSDIRSLLGVTIVRNTDIENKIAQDKSSYRSKLSIKVDPYPFLKRGINSRDKIKDIILSDMRKIMGIKGFIESNKENE